MALCLVKAPSPSSSPSTMSAQVEILSARIANSAYHGTQLDAAHIAQVLEASVDQACARRGVTRAEMARTAVYVSHETFTKLCAKAEVQALRHVFGEAVGSVVITNTKAFLGHAMGANMEDVAAVTALREQCAPRVDTTHLDDEFCDLRFSDGRQCALDYAVHAAGSGRTSPSSCTRACKRKTWRRCSHW